MRAQVKVIFSKFLNLKSLNFWPNYPIKPFFGGNPRTLEIFQPQKSPIFGQIAIALKKSRIYSFVKIYKLASLLFTGVPPPPPPR